MCKAVLNFYQGWQLCLHSGDIWHMSSGRYHDKEQIVEKDLSKLSEKRTFYSKQKQHTSQSLISLLCRYWDFLTFATGSYLLPPTLSVLDYFHKHPPNCSLPALYPSLLIKKDQNIISCAFLLQMIRMNNHHKSIILASISQIP